MEYNLLLEATSLVNW